MILADQAFDQEENYCTNFLQPETRPKLINRVLKELITNRSQQILEKDTGCRYMIENRREDELRLLYKCFSRDENNLGRVIHILCDYIEEFGGKMIKDEALNSNPVEFTAKLLGFKKDMDDLIAHSFNNNLKFEKGRDIAFQTFMNTNQNTPTYIANYTDNELRVGIQGKNSDEVEERLNGIIRLFCCLHGRDVYVKAYQGYLCKRLLNK